MIIRHRARRAIELVCLLLIGATLCGPTMAGADEAPDAQVEVSSIRSPGAIPYKLAYRLLRAMAQTGEPARVVAHIRILGVDKLPVPSLKLRLVGATIDQMVPVSSEGEVTVPLSEAAYNEGAEIVSNKKKGTLRTSIALQPQFAGPPVRYRDLVSTIQSARRVRDELLPWYLRLVLPTVNAIHVCFAGADQSVILHAETDVRRNADLLDTEDEVALHCARFGANESDIAADAELVLPPGVTYRFGL